MSGLYDKWATNRNRDDLLEDFGATRDSTQNKPRTKTSKWWNNTRENFSPKPMPRQPIKNIKEERNHFPSYNQTRNTQWYIDKTTKPLPTKKSYIQKYYLFSELYTKIMMGIMTALYNIFILKTVTGQFSLRRDTFLHTNSHYIAASQKRCYAENLNFKTDGLGWGFFFYLPVFCFFT